MYMSEEEAAEVLHPPPRPVRGGPQDVDSWSLPTCGHAPSCLCAHPPGTEPRGGGGPSCFCLTAEKQGAAEGLGWAPGSGCLYPERLRLAAAGA